jgi:hypothetical protein
MAKNRLSVGWLNGAHFMPDSRIPGLDKGEAEVTVYTNSPTYAAEALQRGEVTQVVVSDECRPDVRPQRRGRDTTSPAKGPV